MRLIRFTEQGIDACRKSTEDVFAQTVAAVNAADARLLGGFATLGAYDVMSILEARDAEHIARVDARIAELGFYTVVEQTAIVDLKEFVQFSRSSPIFVQAWLESRRDHHRGGAPGGAGQTALPAAKASIPPRRRPENANDRKTKRSVVPGAFTVSVGAHGPYPVQDFSLVGTDGAVGMSFAVPPADAKATGLLDVERGGTLALFHFEFLAERLKSPAAAIVRRVDPDAKGNYVVGVESMLPRALFGRVERKLQEAVKPGKGR
ncbi:MAG: GYD domain-containing protein [Deltaproteobacteria bacterium]